MTRFVGHGHHYVLLTFYGLDKFQGGNRTKTRWSFAEPKTGIVEGARSQGNMAYSPETNIAPEDRPLEKEIPIGNHHF